MSRKRLSELRGRATGIVVRADEKLTAFSELESAVRPYGELP